MPPTTYRPVQARPAAPPKKANTLLIGLIACAVVALIGLGLAGMLWSGKSSLQAKVLQHEDSAGALAKTLGVAVGADTNSPVDWTATWSAMDKAANDLKKELADGKVQAATLAQQLADLQPVTTELADTKTKLDQQALQLKQRTAELDALKQTSQLEMTELQTQLETAKAAQAAAEAAAAAAAATQVVTTDSAPSAEVAADGSAETSVPAAPDAVAPADVSMTPVAPTDGEVSDAETEPVAQDGQHTFPKGSTSLIQKLAYDGQGKILKAHLLDGTELVYRTVPPELYDNLVGAPVPDTYFRLHVVGVFPCTPDDKAAVRAFSKKR